MALLRGDSPPGVVEAGVAVDGLDIDVPETVTGVAAGDAGVGKPAAGAALATPGFPTSL